MQIIAQAAAGELLAVVLPAAVIVGLMACVVAAFRMLVRRPRSASGKDAPGIRSVAVFHGDAPELFRDDRDDLPWVGVRLFGDLCAGLTAKGVRVEDRGPVEFAQGARCVVDEEPFSLVLERIEDCWVASVEYSSRTAAEARHLRWSRHAYAPGDSPALRRFLGILDRVLQSHPHLGPVGWHRKQEWLGSSFSDAAAAPVESIPG